MTDTLRVLTGLLGRVGHASACDRKTHNACQQPFRKYLPFAFLPAQTERGQNPSR